MVNSALLEELSGFFIEAWDTYCDSPASELEWLLIRTGLVDEHLVTQEDIDNDRTPDGYEVDDTCYVLSSLGHQAWDVAKARHERVKAEMVNSQRSVNDTKE